VGWPFQQDIAVGAIVSVASTMVLSRFLIERGELRTVHGRIMIGMVLVEAWSWCPDDRTSDAGSSIHSSSIRVGRCAWKGGARPRSGGFSCGSEYARETLAHLLTLRETSKHFSS
jgi:hypothetical protein